MENIAILTGGDSAEYTISLMSADTVHQFLDKSKYNSFIILLKEGTYSHNNIELDTSDFSCMIDKKKILFNKVFIALHGPPAENGLIQDYLDELEIPYTCCNASISALTFDKYTCNKTLTKLGFDCAESIILNTDDLIDLEAIIKSLRLPLFVKPNGSGSSFGVSKVKTKEELLPAITEAFKYDTKILLESFIDGTEISCGVYFDGTKINSLPITEIVTNNEFFDYEAKYYGKSKEITPARINKILTKKVQETTIDIYKKMKLSGICRIDYIIMNNKPFIIEINTIPGLSKKSIIPQQLKVAKISLSKVFDMCLDNLN